MAFVSVEANRLKAGVRPEKIIWIHFNAQTSCESDQFSHESNEDGADDLKQPGLYLVTCDNALARGNRAPPNSIQIDLVY
jgi:hypothetical protein